MLNQVVIAGRLTADPEIVTSDNNKKRTYITVAVPRSYKNVNGTYDTDFIRCILWGGIAESTCEYCQKGDIVGIKGRLQTSSYEKEDGEKAWVTDVIAEKVSFLSSKKTDE
jgi:single-strand DNA-binding protein